MSKEQRKFYIQMTCCRVLRLFIGTKLAARCFDMRPHWVRDARECGWSFI